MFFVQHGAINGGELLWSHPTQSPGREIWLTENRQGFGAVDHAVGMNVKHQQSTVRVPSDDRTVSGKQPVIDTVIGNTGNQGTL